MRFSSCVCVGVTLGAIAACVGEKEGPRGGGAGTSGGAGEGGSSGASGEGGAPGAEDLGELRALEACAVPEPCGERDSFAQLIENQARNMDEESLRCVLSALAARRPGRYVHHTDSTFSNGSSAAKHVFVVGADGTAAYVRDPRQSFSGPEPRETVLPPDPAQRCTLKPASYFEACLAAVARTAAGATRADDEGWACAFGDGEVLRASRLDWFERCEPESPPRCTSGSLPGCTSGSLPLDAGATCDGDSADAGADAAADADAGAAP